MISQKLPLALGLVALTTVVQPAFAQSGEATVKELLGRAQTESGKRAVEDLIDKLSGARNGGAARQQSPAASPPAGPRDAAPAPTAPIAAPAVVPQPPAASVPPSTSTEAAPAVVVTPAPAPPAAPVATQPPATARQTATEAPAKSAATPPTSTPAVVPRPRGPASLAIAPPASPQSPASAAQPTLTPGADEPPAAAAATAQPRATDAAPARPVTAPPQPVVVRPTVKSLVAKPFASDAEMAKAPEMAEKLDLPRADIEVLFDLDSAHVTARARETLDTLGAALADPRLAGQKFVVAGHTDGYGPDSYNVQLSQRRADAVRQYMIQTFDIAPANLIARGFGESQLKNKRNPFAPENRRVQIINWTSQTAGEPRN